MQTHEVKRFVTCHRLAVIKTETSVLVHLPKSQRNQVKPRENESRGRNKASCLCLSLQCPFSGILTRAGAYTEAEEEEGTTGGFKVSRTGFHILSLVGGAMGWQRGSGICEKATRWKESCLKDSESWKTYNYFTRARRDSSCL
jgi:hypothetical protein